MAKVYGTNLPDNLTGLFDGITDGDDIIFGFGGSDQIFAKGGNDILQGGDGHDYLNGGDGIDTANYGDSPEGVIVNLAYVNPWTGYGSGVPQKAIRSSASRTSPAPGSMIFSPATAAPTPYPGGGATTACRAVPAPTPSTVVAASIRRCTPNPRPG